MAITIAHITNSTTSLSVTIPSTTAGNTLVVCVMSYSFTAQGSVSGITLGGSAGNFSQLCAAHETNGTFWSDTFIWADPNCAGSQTAIVVSGTNLTITSGGLVVVYEVSGLGTAVLDVSSTGNGNSASYSSGTTGTTATASEFWVGAVGAGNFITKPGSPWTDSGGGVSEAASGYQIVSSTGTATYSGTLTSNPWSAAVVTLRAQPNTTTTGAMTLRPSLAASGLGGNTTTSGGVTLKPSLQGTDIETFTATGAMTLRPAMAGAVVQGFPFPQKIQTLKIELLLNGTWTDISSYAYQRADILIQRGKPNETTGMTPSSMTLTLNNRDGRFTPGNTSGAFYPFIGRNTQIRVSAQNSPIYSTLSYRYWGEVSEWPPSWDNTGNDVYVPIAAGGWLQRLHQGAAIGTPLAQYIAGLTGPAAPLGFWLCDDASGASQFASYLAGGSAMTWTGTPTLAVDTSFDGIGAIAQFNGSAWTGTPGSFSSGSVTYTTPGTYPLAIPGGMTSISSVECWGGSGGGAAVDGTSPPGAAVSGGDGGISSFAGDSVTITAHGGKGGIANGTTDSPGGTGSTNTTHHDGGAGYGANVIAGGGGGGSGGSSSAGNAATSSTGAAAVTGGGPGGNGGNSPGVSGSSPASGPGGGGGGGYGAAGPGINGGPGGGAGEYAKETLVAVTPGNSYNVVVGAAGAGGAGSYDNGANGWAGQVTLTYTTVTTPYANAVRFLLHVPSTGGVNGAVYCRFTTAGTIATVDVIYGTGGTLQVIGYNASHVAQFTSTAAGSYNGVPVIVSVELTPSGSSIAWALKTILPGTGMSPTTLASGTVASSSIGNVSTVLGNPGGTETGAVSAGGYIVQGVVTSLSDLATAASGYNGEYAADRFTRLCTEFGIGYSLIGTNTDTPQMGPQQNDTLPNILQSIEDFDRGQMFEARGFFGMTYRTRKNMQNQSPVVTYNYTSGELAQPLQPVADLQMTRNDVTVSRSGGSSARQYLATGTLSILTPPNGVGEYTYSLTAIAYADTQLSNCALWIMTVGTVAGNRYPAVNIDMARNAAQGNFAVTAAMDIGDYFQIASPPSFAESATVKQLAFGFTEALNAFKRTMTINAVPEIPYEGGGLPTW